MRLHIKEYKSWAWPFCALLYNISRLVPFRNKHLWLFGNYEGNAYDDNTRFVFEYISKECKDKITAVWFTKSKETVRRINEQGNHAVLIGTWASIWYLLRCGCVIYTHSLYDFGMYPLMGGAYKATTWHGFGFKKIYGNEWTGFGLYIRRIKNFFFNWLDCDCACVPSEYSKRQFETILGIAPNHIFITGQPRNDELFKPLNRRRILADAGLPIDKKIILYLPTWRNAFQRGISLDEIIEGLVTNPILNRTLKDQSCCLVVKLHPNSPVPKGVLENDYFKILSYQSVSSNYELIACGDIMITDYSSCFVDFSLLNRPVLFYTPDEAEYLASCGGMDDDFYRISSMCSSRTPEQLASLIQEHSNIVAVETNLIFDDNSTHTGSFTYNVVEVVESNLGM